MITKAIDYSGPPVEGRMWIERTVLLIKYIHISKKNKQTSLTKLSPSNSWEFPRKPEISVVESNATKTIMRACRVSIC